MHKHKSQNEPLLGHMTSESQWPNACINNNWRALILVNIWYPRQHKLISKANYHYFVFPSFFFLWFGLGVGWDEGVVRTDTIAAYLVLLLLYPCKVVNVHTHTCFGTWAYEIKPTNSQSPNWWKILFTEENLHCCVNHEIFNSRNVINDLGLNGL